ncbi:MAG: DUF2066 domain-containing protein [Gammaproteobacteria bacterium]|nr:DUF2066 domain-containing protein [Gammaproteobacteria bacterium]
MMKRVFLLLTFLSLGFSGALQATTLPNLYEVITTVPDQTNETRQLAISQAFDELLVRVTGDAGVVLRPELAKLRASAAQWVRQFSYERVTPPAPPPSADGSKVAPPKPYLQLRAKFDEEPVNEALWKNKLPVWGKVRPSVLVWLAVQSDDRRFMMDPNDPSNELVQSLRSNSERRGVPLVMPMMDLEDQLNMNYATAWEGTDDQIMKASKRYAPEAVLVGRISNDGFGGWKVRWSLYQQGVPYHWSVADITNLTQVAAIGIDGVADNLAQRYAHVGEGESGAYWLEITDVKSLQDYARVGRYLKSLAAVDGLELQSVIEDQLSFRVNVRGGIASLEQAISLGSTLKATQKERFSDRVLVYSLQP